MPGAHSAQLDALALAEKWPNPHALHIVAPDALEKVPGQQLAHAPVPMAQFIHPVPLIPVLHVWPLVHEQMLVHCAP